MSSARGYDPYRRQRDQGPLVHQRDWRFGRRLLRQALAPQPEVDRPYAKGQRRNVWTVGVSMFVHAAGSLALAVLPGLAVHLPAMSGRLVLGWFATAAVVGATDIVGGLSSERVGHALFARLTSAAIGLDRLRPNDDHDPAGSVSRAISRDVRMVRDVARNDIRQAFRDFLLLGLTPIALGAFGMFAGIGVGSAMLMGLSMVAPIVGVTAIGTIAARRHLDLVDEEAEHDQEVHNAVARSTSRLAKRLLAAYDSLSTVRMQTDDSIDGMTRAHEKQARLRLLVVGAALLTTLAGAALPVALAMFGVVSAPLLPTALTFIAIYGAVQVPLLRSVSCVARIREAIVHLENAEWDLYRHDPLGVASEMTTERTVLARSNERGNEAAVLRLVNVGYAPGAKVDAELGFQHHVTSLPRFELGGVDLSIRLDEPHVVAVVGAVGSGKSTVGKIVAGLESPTSGEVVLEDSRGHPLPDRKRLVTGFVPAGEELPFPTIRAALAAADPSLAGLSSNQVAERIAGSLFDRVTPHFKMLLNDDPGLLSSGQRMALWHTMNKLRGSKLMVLDEPFSNLDVASRAEVVDWLTSASKSQSMVIITHARIEPVALRCEVVLVGRPPDGGPSTVLEHWPDASRAPFSSQYMRQTCLQMYAQGRNLQPTSDVALVNRVNAALDAAEPSAWSTRERASPLVDQAYLGLRFPERLDREGDLLAARGRTLDPDSSSYFEDALGTWTAIFQVERALRRVLPLYGKPLSADQMFGRWSSGTHPSQSDRDF